MAVADVVGADREQRHTRPQHNLQPPALGEPGDDLLRRGVDVGAARRPRGELAARVMDQHPA